ncbi:hypothetical protein, partial [Bacillus spizizenii]
MKTIKGKLGEVRGCEKAFQKDIRFQPVDGGFEQKIGGCIECGTNQDIKLHTFKVADEDEKVHFELST